MILFVFAIFWFRSLKSLHSKGLSPKIDKMGCPDFGPQIGHFRGGFGSAGPIFANFRHFSATNIGGILANHEGAVFKFFVTFWQPAVSAVKNARAEGL